MKNFPAAFALLISILGAPLAMATPVTFTAALSGANESPPNNSAGTGFATILYDAALHTLSVNVTFSGLTGTTTAAHIHCCTVVPNGGNIGVATETPSFNGFPLGVTSGSYLDLFDLTLASSFNAAFITANGGTVAGAEAALAAGMFSGRSYLNIHSSFRGGGEIRGFLVQAQAVPEPGTLALLGLGLAALAFGQRRKLAGRAS